MLCQVLFPFIVILFTITCISLPSLVAVLTFILLLHKITNNQKLTYLHGAGIQYIVHYCAVKREQNKFVETANQKFAEGSTMLTLAEKIEKVATKEDLKLCAIKEDLNKLDSRVDTIISILQAIPFLGDHLKK